MIEVKGTKATPSAAAAERSRYDFEGQEKASKTPFVLATALIGLALYLKSMFPSWASLGEAEKPEVDTGRPSEPAGKALASMVPIPDMPLDEQSTGTVAAADRGAPGSGGTLIARQPPAVFDIIPSPEIDPVSMVSPEQRFPFDVGNDFSFRPANDNPAGAPAGGGTGGGGAGNPPSGPAPLRPPSSGDGATPGGPPASGGSKPGDNPGPGAKPGDSAAPGGGSKPGDDAGPGGGDGNPDGDPDDDGEAPGPGPNPGTPNRAPRLSGPVQLGDVYGCAVALFGLNDLLRNATDPDGDVLAVRNVKVSSGTLQQTEDGWLFSAASLGPVIITYEVTDGQHSVTQYAYLTVRPAPPIVGTDGDDTLLGTECADEIDGKDGDDNIDGRGGNDVIYGGAGHDHIMGGAGDDIIYGGGGNDIIFGGPGNDRISGGPGNDRLFGDEGDDTIFGDEGDDQIWGGTGNDLLFGGSGNDIVYGEAGNDTISGGDGRDTLSGGAGNDLISGGAGDDVIHGGEGDDRLFGDEGNDVIEGGAGNDTMYGGAGKDVLKGGTGDDVLHGEEGNDRLFGDEGNDVLHGGGGDDVLHGGAGDDVLRGGTGDDVLHGDEGDDRLFGDDGCDILYGGDGDDMLHGGAGNDILYDGGGSDTVDGGTGDDVVMAAADGEDDYFEGGAGYDTIDYSSTKSGIVIDLKAKTATGIEIGNDRISGFEAVVGGAGDDRFIVGTTPVSLRGGGGNDVFEFTAASGSSAAARVVHEILDFMVGDRIKLKHYDIYEEVLDEIEDRFEDIYGKGMDDDDMPIRIRHERTDNVRKTIVEADFDGDNIYELSIHLTGDHVLMIVDHA